MSKGTGILVKVPSSFAKPRCYQPRLILALSAEESRVRFTSHKSGRKEEWSDQTFPDVIESPDEGPWATVVFGCDEESSFFCPEPEGGAGLTEDFNALSL